MTDRRTQLRMGAAVAAVFGVLAGFGAFAWYGWGPIAAAAFGGALVLGATLPPATILLLRDGLPLKGVLGVGLAIAAQVAFGRAALVRRDDGEYEWTVLREDDSHGYFARLTDGREVVIDATPGEWYRFGFGDLAITEQKTRANLDEYRVVESPADSDQATDERAGVPVKPPHVEQGEIPVSLATVGRRVRGSSSSELVRRGRDKALNDEGGMQALSPLWTMAFATVLLLVGFGMTAGVMLV
jgi:hypothetical protein